MDLTTTPSFEGRTITRYCGVVAGEAVLGANVFKDMFASIRDIVGGRSGTSRRSCAKPAKLPWMSLRSKPENWVPMPS